MLFATLLTLGALAAPLPNDDQLQPGHWIEVKGNLGDGRLFHASSVKLVDPEDKETIIGTVTASRSDGSRLMCLGQEIHVSDKTDWINLQAAAVVGKRVKIEGYYRGVRKFSARSIAPRGAGRARLVAPIDRIERTSTGLEVALLSFRVVIADDVPIKAERPYASYERTTPRTPSDLSKLATERKRDDDDDIRGSFRIGDEFSLGVRAEWTLDDETNFNLRSPNREDRTDNQVAVRAEAIWAPSESFYALLGYRGAALFRREEGSPSEDLDRSRLSELYGYVRDVGLEGLDLQIGRQDFDEEREWLYDQNLDGVRVILDQDAWRAELSATTTASDGSPRDEASDNLMLYLTNQDDDKLIGAYVIDRRDDRNPNDYPIHMGVRALGEWVDDHDVWAEFSLLRGYMGNTDLRGYAWDVGSTWSPDWAGGAYLTAGWSFGSGDDNGFDLEDNAFRQTGLHDNNDKWGGVTSFKYYGELFDPELSNLSMLTLGLGTRIGRRSSIDLAYHRYAQDVASNTLRDTGLDRAPDGVHRDLGDEIDLIFGTRAIENIDLEIVLSQFDPGAAFPGTSPAYLAKFQVRLRF